ncbi:Ger(x)C family spore germination protein [Rossellomorea sp. NS-SX7]|uniref:Ger(x)C family spore germination protein n=1 Tax=Rossellomorea sp. NS-SX7 TaxID=3463856 RepID=UPI0040590F3F
MKILKVSIILLLVLNLVTGCWNRRELSELVIALAIGLDKTDDGYRFTVQLINPTVSSEATKKGAVGSTVRTISSEGKTLFSAWRKLTKATPRKTYFAHVQLLVLQEGVVKEDISKFLDPLIRDHDFRTDFNVLISKENSAKEVMTTLTYLEPIPALALKSMLAASNENLGTTTVYEFDEILEDLKTKGKELVISGVSVLGDAEEGSQVPNTETSDPKTYLKLDNLAVFKESRIMGWFNENQSKGYNYSQGRMKSTSELLSCPMNKEGNLTVEIIRTNANMTAKLINGQPKIKIDVEAEGNLVDVECKLDPSDLKILEEIEKDLAKKIKSEIKDTITVSQEEFKSDTLGFGSVVHRKEPAYWRENKERWADLFPEIQYEIKVSAKVRNTGSLGKSLSENGG